LTNMTDRVSAIGGKVKIDTAPGQGTCVTAVVETAAQPNSDPSVKDGLSSGLMPSRS
jgi:signal transduction histidine kinase